MTESVQEKLRRLMKERGWNQAEVARRLRVSATAVAKWRSGGRPLPIYEEQIDNLLRTDGTEQPRVADHLHGAGPPPAAIMTGAGELTPVPAGSRAAVLMDAIQQLGKVLVNLQAELADVMRQQAQESRAARQDEGESASKPPATDPSRS